MPRRRLARTVLAVIAAAALCVAVVPSCRNVAPDRQSAADDTRAPAATAPFRVFATGDTRGYVEPCGCETGQVGGVPRRGTYLRATRRPGDLWIDLGNVTAGTGELRRLRREAVLDAIRGLRYDALVPGRAELADGAEFEADAASRGIRVVAANVTDDAGRLVFEPWLVATLPDGRKIGVVGIAEPPDRAAPGRIVTPADAALRRAVAELSGEVDAIVAATSLPLDAARALADASPDVALVLSGSTPEPDVPFPAGPAALVGVAGHLGEYVARVDFDASLRPSLTWRAWLDEKLADDPEMDAIVQRYRKGAQAIDRRMVEKLVDGYRTDGFAGSLSCAPCHRAEVDVWKASRHATAMRSLVAKETQRDPDCVPCHLVDVPDRADAWDPDAMGVGCETCHGPSAAHAADPEVRTPSRDGGRAACASRCHHPPEVKHFDLETHWPRIRHGGK